MANKTRFKYTSHLPRALKAVDDAAEERVESAVHTVRNKINDTLSGEGEGKLYKVPKTKNTYYRASLPGNPPAQRLGNLRGSIDWEVIERNGMIVGRVGTYLEYGAKLETGVYPAGPPEKVHRPWMRPSFKAKEREIKRIMGGRRWF